MKTARSCIRRDIKILGIRKGYSLIAPAVLSPTIHYTAKRGVIGEQVSVAGIDQLSVMIQDQKDLSMIRMVEQQFI